MNNKPRVIFFGTPWIAKECLSTLFGLDINLVLVVSQPDKEINRKKEIVYSEVKSFCLENDIKIIQPNKISESYEDIKELEPDIIITCAYGQFIPSSILMIPKYGTVNIHASLLPKLRGGAPIHWAIINGDKKTGITLMYTVKEMDAGNIIFQQSIDILENDTYKTMLIKLTNLAQEMIKKHFFDLLSNNVKSIEQDNNKVTKGFNIKKEDEIINFNDFINNIDCKIRGLFDKPIAKFKYLNNLYKIHHASKTMTKSTKDPATIVEINKNGIFVATKDFDICLDLIQQPNKKPMHVKDIINGHHEFKIGEKLI